jgi:hypothetical protein
MRFEPAAASGLTAVKATDMIIDKQRQAPPVKMSRTPKLGNWAGPQHPRPVATTNESTLCQA